MPNAGLPTTMVPVATSMADTDEFLINQGGGTKRISKANAGAGGGGGGPELILLLQSTSSTYTFNGSDYSNWNSATTVLASENAEWNSTSKVVDVQNPGLYKVTIAGKIKSASNWPTGGGDWSLFGSYVPESVSTYLSRSQYFRETEGSFQDSDEQFVQWYDEFYAVVAAEGDPITPTVFGKKYSGSSEQGTYYALVTITRVGDVPA